MFIFCFYSLYNFIAVQSTNILGIDSIQSVISVVAPNTLEHLPAVPEFDLIYLNPQIENFFRELCNLHTDVLLKRIDLLKNMKNLKKENDLHNTIEYQNTSIYTLVKVPEDFVSIFISLHLFKKLLEEIESRTTPDFKMKFQLSKRDELLFFRNIHQIIGNTTGIFDNITILFDLPDFFLLDFTYLYCSDCQSKILDEEDLFQSLCSFYKSVTLYLEILVQKIDILQLHEMDLLIALYKIQNDRNNMSSFFHKNKKYKDLD